MFKVNNKGSRTTPVNFEQKNAGWETFERYLSISPMKKTAKLVQL